MKSTAAVFAVFAGLVATQSPDTLEVLLRYAVEFGGAFGGCVVALLPFVVAINKRQDRQDVALAELRDSQAALHERLDEANVKGMLVVPMSPGRTLGQRRTRSGSFRAVRGPQTLQAPPSSDDGNKPPDGGKGK